jgi:hypothetical protein
MARRLLCLCSLWDEVVIRCTHAQSTVNSDRLMTLSGIAKEVQTMIGDEYKAGLWRRHMIHQLLWDVAGRSQAPSAYPYAFLVLGVRGWEDLPSLSLFHEEMIEIYWLRYTTYKLYRLLRILQDKFYRAQCR